MRVGKVKSAMCGGVLLAGLAGCGGGSFSDLSASTAPVTQSTQDVLETRFTDLAALSDEIIGDGTSANPGLYPTRETNMPVSGTATAAGLAGVTVYDAADPTDAVVMAGPMVMTVDFGSGTMRGSASQFVGSHVNLDTDQQIGGAISYSGTLNFSNGCIGTACADPAVAGNEGKIDAAGSLSGGGDTVQASAGLDVSFRGNPQIKAIAGAGSGTGALNGTARDSMIVFFAKPN